MSQMTLSLSLAYTRILSDCVSGVKPVLRAPDLPYPWYTYVFESLPRRIGGMPQKLSSGPSIDGIFQYGPCRAKEAGRLAQAGGQR